MTEAPVIVDPQGRPARKAADRNCPRCRRGPDRRVASAGFGTDRHDVCGHCGYEFDEFTVEEERK